MSYHMMILTLFFWEVRCIGDCYIPEPAVTIDLEENIVEKLKIIFQEYDFGEYSSEEEELSKTIRSMINYIDQEGDLNAIFSWMRSEFIIFPSLSLCQYLWLIQTGTDFTIERPVPNFLLGHPNLVSSLRYGLAHRCMNLNFTQQLNDLLCTVSFLSHWFSFGIWVINILTHHMNQFQGDRLRYSPPLKGSTVTVF